MKSPKNIVLNCLTIILVTSCKPNFEKIFEENNNNFELHRTSLNNLIASIENKYLVNWNEEEIKFSSDSAAIPINNLLEDIGIGSVNIIRNTNDNCNKNYWIVLNVEENWNINNLRQVQLIFAPCEEKTKRNYHYSDGYHRDFWGQGDNWFIYSDSDAF